jgi:hypothetical protein
VAGAWRRVVARRQVAATQLLDLLAEGALDAVLYPGGGGGNWFQWVEGSTAQASSSHYGDLETLVRERPALEFSLGDPETILAWFRKTGVYPLFHMMALHQEVAEQHPGLVEALTEAFRQAAGRARGYLSPPEQGLYDREIELLGVDPNQPGVTPMVRRSIEALVDALDADGVLPRRPSVGEVFSFASE